MKRITFTVECYICGEKLTLEGESKSELNEKFKCCFWYDKPGSNPVLYRCPACIAGRRYKRTEGGE